MDDKWDVVPDSDIGAAWYHPLETENDVVFASQISAISLADDSDSEASTDLDTGIHNPAEEVYDEGGLDDSEQHRHPKLNASQHSQNNDNSQRLSYFSPERNYPTEFVLFDSSQPVRHPNYSLESSPILHEAPDPIDFSTNEMPSRPLFESVSTGLPTNSVSRSKAPTVTETATSIPIQMVPVTKRSLRKRTIEQLYPYRIELERYRLNFKQVGINVTRKEAREEAQRGLGKLSETPGQDNTENLEKTPRGKGRHKKQDKQSGEREREREKAKHNKHGGDEQNNKHQEKEKQKQKQKQKQLHGGMDEHKMNLIAKKSSADPIVKDLEHNDHHTVINRRKRIIQEDDSQETDRIDSEVPANTENETNINQPDRAESPVSLSLSDEDDFSSGTEETSDSEVEREREKEALATFKKRVKGVLPPSFITLEYAKFQKQQKLKEILRRGRDQQKNKDLEAPQKGVARRKVGSGRTTVHPVGDMRVVADSEISESIPASSAYDDQPTWQAESDHGVEDDDHLSDDMISGDYQDLSISGSEVEEEDQVDFMVGGRRLRPGAIKKTPARTVTGSGKPSNRTNRYGSSGKNTAQKSRNTSSYKSPRSKQLNISDMCDSIRQGGARLPRFMSISERSAIIRTKSRPDNYSKKYIHIEEEDGEYVRTSESPATTIRRWKKGKLVSNSRSSKGELARAKTLSPKENADSNVNLKYSRLPRPPKLQKHIIRHKASRVVQESSKLGATKHRASRDTDPPLQNLEVRSNTRESYLENRRRHFQTAILEIPSGRYAVRRSGGVQARKSNAAAIFSTTNQHDNSNRHDNSNQHDLTKTVNPKRFTMDVYDRVAQWTLQADKSANPGGDIHSQTPLPELAAIPTTLEPTDPKASKRKNRAIRKELRREERWQRDRPEIQRNDSENSSENVTLLELSMELPSYGNLLCDIFKPSDDLKFSDQSFMGSGYLRHILFTPGAQNLDASHLSSIATVNIEGIAMVLSGPAFSSSLGLALSSLKERIEVARQGNLEDLSEVVKLIRDIFNALFSIVYLGRSRPGDFNPNELASALSEYSTYIKTQWQLQGSDIFGNEAFAKLTLLSFSMSLAILNYLDGMVVSLPSNISRLDTYILQGYTFMLELIWNNGGLVRLKQMIRSHRSSLKRVINDDSYLLESVYIASSLLNELPKGKFSDILARFAQSNLRSGGLNKLDDIWTGLFCFCYIRSLAAENEGQIVEISWKIPKLLISTLTSLLKDDDRSDYFGRYLSLSLHRCIHLILYWKWPSDRLLVVSLFDFFARRQFNNIEQVTDGSTLPKVLLDEKEFDVYRTSDSAFVSFLKLTGVTIGSLRQNSSIFDIQKLNARITPLNSRYYSRSSALMVSDLEALCNQYSILLLRFAFCPVEARPSIEQLRDMNVLNDSHIKVRSLGVSVWKTLITLLLREKQDIEGAMVWFSNVLSNTLKEFDDLEKTAQNEEDMENQRRLENQDQYAKFFLDSMLIWSDVLKGDWVTSNPTWYKLLRKPCIKILKYGISAEVSHVCLGMVNHYISCCESEFDLSDSLEEDERPAVDYFHDVVFQDFYQCISNMIGNDMDLPRSLLVGSVCTWAKVANFLVINNRVNWDSFLISSYSWNWFSYNKKRENLEPVWFSEVFKFTKGNVQPELFLQEFVTCLVKPHIMYEPKMVEEFIRNCQDSWMEPLRKFSGLVKSAIGFTRLRKEILREVVLSLARLQLDQAEFVRATIGHMLGSVKENYSKDPMEYLDIAEYCVGLVIEYLEFPHIPHLAWFRDTSNFKSAKSVVIDTANVRKYTRVSVNSHNQSRLLMFMVYSLEASLVGPSLGETFTQSVCTALADADTSQSARRFVMETIFPAYARVALKSDVGEVILPSILETVRWFITRCKMTSETSTNQYVPLLRDLCAYLKLNHSGLYVTKHPFWTSARLLFDILRELIEMYDCRGMEMTVDEELLCNIIEICGFILLKELCDEYPSQYVSDTRDGVSSAILQSLKNYEKEGGQDSWVFKRKNSDDKISMGRFTDPSETQRSVAWFLRCLFRSETLPVLVCEEGKRLLEKLEVNGGRPELIEMLLSVTPNIGGYQNEPSLIDDVFI